MKKIFIKNSKNSHLLRIKNVSSQVDTRNEELDGKEYLVVPCVMIVEGVHNGSQGPLFYSSEELNKFTCCWNMKPVLLRHPDIEGSGTQLDVLKNQAFGMLLNTEFSNGKLKTEVWIDKEKANKLDSRIIERIENEQMIEVSTGLFLEIDNTAGVWNLEQYQAKTLNYHPDHLAVLLDCKGACSIKDGAGLLRNKEYKVVNEIGHRIIHEELSALIRVNDTETSWSWVLDVFDKYFIYERDEKFYQQDYSISSEDVVSLTGEAIEVKREIKFEPITNNKEVMVDKKQKIEWLCKNAKHPYKAEFLNEFEEPVLDKLIENAKATETVEVEEPTENTEVKVENTEVKVENTEVKVENEKSVEQYLAEAPEAIRAVFNSLLKSQGDKKSELVENILKAEGNSFTKEILDAMPLEQVEMISNLAKPKTETPPAPETGVVVNSDGTVTLPTENEEGPGTLEVPTLYAPQPVSNSSTDDDVPSLKPIPLFEN